ARRFGGARPARAHSAACLAGRGIHGADRWQPGIRDPRSGRPGPERRSARWSGWNRAAEYAMTTTAPEPWTAAEGGPSAQPPAQRIRVGGLLLAEWTKIRSVRSTVWTLVLFVVLTIGLTAGLTALVVGTWSKPGSGDGHVRIIADPVGFIIGAGIGLG